MLLISCLTNSLAQTWNQISSGTTKSLNTICFASNTIGYIGGQDSLLLKTTNGGETWSPISFTGVTFFPGGDAILNLKFVSDSVGFMTVGPYSGTYKTVDGGLTWTAIDNLYACYNSGLYFFDENNGFLGGGGCFSGEIINKLSAGTWIESNMNPMFIQTNGIVNNFDFNTTDMGIATGTSHYFFRTTNGGITWDSIPNTLNAEDTLTSVLFVNNSTVLATYLHHQSTEFGVLISTDTGLTWQVDMNFATFDYPRMYASEKAGNGRIYVGGESSTTIGGIPGLIFEGDGSSSNWIFATVDHSIHAFDSYNDSVVFAVGDNGYIVVNQAFNSVGLQPADLEKNIAIFPNPNRGNFTVSHNTGTFDRIELIDASGKIIYNKTTLPTHSAEINLSNAKAGVYQLRLYLKNEQFLKTLIIE